MVIKESNAIGTAVLRSKLLPEAKRTCMNELFKEYVNVEFSLTSRANVPKEEKRTLNQKARQLQTLMWSEVNTATTDHPLFVPAGLFETSINQLMDIRTERDIAISNHVPEIVLIALLLFAALAIGILGYGNGLAATHARYHPLSCYYIVLHSHY